MLTKIAFALLATFLASAANAKPKTSNFEPTYKQLFEAGCDAQGNGSCERKTYDPKTEFKDLITKSFNELPKETPLDFTAKWDNALEQAEYFLDYGAFNESGAEFLDAVSILREEHQIKAIFAMAPTDACDESESCLYMYFFIYLKDGTYFVFEWNQTT